MTIAGIFVVVAAAPVTTYAYRPFVRRTPSPGSIAVSRDQAP